MNHLICVILPIWFICLGTDDAVRRFQLMHGLKADGIYGLKTKVKLEALLK
ncbi:peptidoglycan-binding protein [Bacillus halotolerans]|nr:peptidoglycan-binding protein [Bacillus halotolerans]